MHCISVVYRKSADSTFDIKYYAEVHIPLAFALLKQKFGVAPVRGELFDESFRMGRDDGSAVHHCIFNMYFKTKEDAERLLDLRDLQDRLDPSQRTVDIRNFSSSDPEVFISEVMSIDTERALTQGNAIIQKKAP